MFTMPSHAFLREQLRRDAAAAKEQKFTMDQSIDRLANHTTQSRSSAFLRENLRRQDASPAPAAAPVPVDRAAALESSLEDGAAAARAPEAFAVAGAAARWSWQPALGFSNQ